jgi:hypothetical protein
MYFMLRFDSTVQVKRVVLPPETIEIFCRSPSPYDHKERRIFLKKQDDADMRASGLFIGSEPLDDMYDRNASGKDGDKKDKVGGDSGDDDSGDSDSGDSDSTDAGDSGDDSSDSDSKD